MGNYSSYFGQVQMYMDQNVKDGEPFNLYQAFAKRIIAEETTTMYVDFEHFNRHCFQDARFMQYLITLFHKFEPDLRAALTRFMVHMNSNGEQAKLKKTTF